jgi:hypothetical protein
MNVQLVVYNGLPIQANSAPYASAVPVTDANGVVNQTGFNATTGGFVNQNGPQQVSIETFTTTATATGRTLVRVNGTTGSFTLTLPPAATVSGLLLFIKRTDAASHLVTVQGNGSETIDGSNTNTSLSSQYAVLRLVSNGVGWDKV